MNKHMQPRDFDGAAALRLVAVPAPGDTASYARLAELEQAAYALWRHIIEYRAIPAYPGNGDYRQQAMETIQADAADMRKALSDG